MSEKENKKGANFKVTDRRLSFDEDEPAKTKDETKASPEPEVKKEEPKEKKSLKEKIFGNKKSENKTAEKTKKEEKQDRDPLPEINLATFILSLSGSAMFHIGEIPNPETGKTEKNLPLAKQSIDIIEMLKEKTKGNLDSDEEKLLDNVLYDLRMKYVNALKS